MPSSAAARRSGDKGEELDQALAGAIAYEGPALVEITSDAELT